MGVDVGSYINASVPKDVRVWITESGAYGAPLSYQTWVHGLFVGRQLLQFLNMGQVDILLPYCLMCGDPAQPSATTPDGSHPPPPNSTFRPGLVYLLRDFHAHATKGHGGILLRELYSPLSSAAQMGLLA